jgi:hypothetical protein
MWAVIGLMLLLSGCQATDPHTGAQWTGSMAAPNGGGGSKLVHAVFFTMRPGTPDSEVDALIADAQQLLSRIPTVRRVDSGRRDPSFTRDVNDKDFTVGLVVYFDDKAGHDVYQDHDLHQQYVSKHKDHWATVRVFDFVAP